MFHCRSIECQSVSDLRFGGRNSTDEFFVYLLSRRNRSGACLTNNIYKKFDFAFVLIYLAFKCIAGIESFRFLYLMSVKSIFNKNAIKHIIFMYVYSIHVEPNKWLYNYNISCSECWSAYQETEVQYSWLCESANLERTVSQYLCEWTQCWPTNVTIEL